jgi:Fe2+ or Zn2+ uptake regulation protein
LDNCLAGFAAKLESQNSFKVLGHTFEFYGLCGKCAGKSGKSDLL